MCCCKKNRWTNDKMPDQTGKVIIVTGSNSGTGYATAKALAEKGAEVIMACRSEERASKAVEEIKKDVKDANVTFMKLDLADLSSVKEFAEEFKGKYDKLDVLVNNAGVMMIPERRETADGFEMQFGTNHLGHFALTGLLLDLLKKTPESRVVSMSSMAHRNGTMKFDNLNSEKSYSKIAVYGMTKLSNLLFTYELDRKLKENNIDSIAVAAHPGWTATNLQRYFSIARFMNRFVAMEPWQGALPQNKAATDPEVKGGEYYGPGGIMEMRGYPKKVGSTKESKDEKIAKKLWEVSEELTGVKYDWE